MNYKTTLSSTLKISGVVVALTLAGCDSDGDAQRLSNLVTVASANYADVQLNGGDAVIAAGDNTTFTLSARTAVQDAEWVEVSGAQYSSSNNSIATVSNNGTLTGILDGEVIVTANYGNLTDTATVRVSSAALSRIDISAPDGAIEVDECGSVQLSAFGEYQGEESQPRDLTDKVLWGVSPATAVFGVADGLLRATSPGVLKVTAGLADVSGSFDITVQDNLTSITVAPAAGELSVGNPLQYIATALYDDGQGANVTKNVTWDLDDPGSTSDFASVSNLITNKGLVTPSRSGDGVLTASCGDVRSAQLEIGSRGTGQIAEVVVASSNPLEVIFGGQRREIQLEAQARDPSGGVIRDITEESEWSVVESSPNLSLSNVDGSKGQVIITGLGEITLTFKYVEDGDEFTSSEFRVISK